MRRNVRREIFGGMVSLTAFASVALLVFSSLTQSLDANGALFVNHTDPGSVGTFLTVLLTEYGREVVWGIVVLVMLLLGGKPTKMLAIELVALLIVGILVGDVAKLALFRARPSEVLSGIVTRVPVGEDSSFPSGHAMSVAIGSAFALLRFRRKALAVALSVEGGAICYSRVYVGVHYPLDVVSGAFLAFAITLIGTNLIDKYLSCYLGELSDLFVRILRDGPIDI